MKHPCFFNGRKPFDCSREPFNKCAHKRTGTKWKNCPIGGKSGYLQDYLATHKIKPTKTLSTANICSALICKKPRVLYISTRTHEIQLAVMPDGEIRLERFGKLHTKEKKRNPKRTDFSA